jgi:hypothetical protein
VGDLDQQVGQPDFRAVAFDRPVTEDFSLSLFIKQHYSGKKAPSLCSSAREFMKTLKSTPHRSVFKWPSTLFPPLSAVI